DGPTKVLYFPNMYPPKADTITGVVHNYIPDDEFYVLRTHLPPMSLTSAIRRIVRKVDPKLLITQIGTLETLVDVSMARARLTLAGIGLGVVGAVVLTGYLRALLYEVSPTDPVAFAAMAALLFAVALAASYVPARRAAKVDPMTALRSE